MQNRRRFRHLNHEGGAAARQVVAGADTGEDPVYQPQPGGTRRNERSHLRQDGDERGLPQIRGLATHIRAGQYQNRVSGRVQIEIVRYEAFATTQFLLLDDGVAAFEDFDVGGIIQLRAAVVSQGGNLGQGGKHIDFRKCERRLPDAPGFSGDGRAQFGEQSALDVHDLFLGIENFRFVLFQFWRGKELSVDQGLFAFIVRRGQVQVGLRNFQVVTKN